ncbi:hypothetical protein [Spirochaeta dissipatitropha]
MNASIKHRYVFGLVLFLLPLLLLSSCASTEIPEEPVEISLPEEEITVEVIPEPEPEPEPIIETPVPLYVNQRFLFLVNNSMYEISQPRGLRFTVRYRELSDFARIDHAPSLFIYTSSDPYPNADLQRLFGLDRQRLDAALQGRRATYSVIDHPGGQSVGILARNIDIALIAIERDQELQELILDILGEHFYEL